MTTPTASVITIERIGADIEGPPVIVLEAPGNRANVVTVSYGLPGPPGPDGPAGPPGAAGAGAGTRQNNYTAGEAVGALRAVYQADDGKVYYADSSDMSHNRRVSGITLASAILDDLVVVLEAGLHMDGGWSWTSGEFVYVGAAGVLTQTVPTSGWLCVVGTAINATSLQVLLQVLFYLELTG